SERSEAQEFATEVSTPSTETFPTPVTIEVAPIGTVATSVNNNEGADSTLSIKTPSGTITEIEFIGENPEQMLDQTLGLLACTMNISELPEQDKCFEALSETTNVRDSFYRDIASVTNARTTERHMRGEHLATYGYVLLPFGEDTHTFYDKDGFELNPNTPMSAVSRVSYSIPNLTACTGFISEWDINGVEDTELSMDFVIDTIYGGGSTIELSRGTDGNFGITYFNFPEEGKVIPPNGLDASPCVESFVDSFTTNQL
ncbi:MAG: hypothetical protein M3Q70_03605, partial [bacterium]|nr:hypothetical protein [bacterium]